MLQIFNFEESPLFDQEMPTHTDHHPQQEPANAAHPPPDVTDHDLISQLGQALAHAHQPEQIKAIAARLLAEVTELDRIAAEAAKAEEQLRNSADRYRTLLNSIDEGFCIIEMIHDENGKPIDYLFVEVNHIFEKQTGLRDVVGKKVSHLSPLTEDHWLQNYDNVARTGQPMRVENYHAGTERWYLANAARVGHAGSKQVGVVFEDITERKRFEQRQALLLQLTDALRPMADPTLIQQTMAHTIRDFYKVDRCFYAEIENGDAVIRRDACPADLPSIAGTYAIGSMPLFNSVLNAGKPFLVTDAHTSPILDEELRALCLSLQIISFLDVPVIKHGVPVGILCITHSVPREWDDFDIELAAEIAERTWTAVERSHAQAALHRAEADERVRKVMLQNQQETFKATLSIQEEERRRISESLHNGLGQLLYGIKISLSHLTCDQATADPNTFITHKQYTDQLLSQAIRESRRISHELMPAMLEDFGLKAAIEDICKQFSNGVQFRCKITGITERLDGYLELAIFRIVQELLTNVIKHAKATLVWANVKLQNGVITISVKDNGKGFNTTEGKRPGIGLASIRSKVKLMNGDVKVITAANEGSTVKVTLPLQRTDS